MFGQYLTHFWLTLSTPRYYLTVVNQSLKRSLWFFLLSCLLLGFVQTGHFITQTVPAWRTTVALSLSEIETYFPPDLVITWDQQRLSLQPASLLAIPYPSRLTPDPDLFPPVIGYISPQEIEPDAFTTLPTSSLAIVTPTRLFLSDQQTWNEVPLAELPGFDGAFHIDRGTLPTLISASQTRLSNLISWLSWVSIFLIPLSMIVSTLLATLIQALFLYFLVRLSGLWFTFKTTLKLSLHVAVVGVLVEQLLVWFYPTDQWPIFSTVFWLYMAVIVWTIRQHVEQRRSQQPIRK